MGKLVAVEGPDGVGKTTLLQHLGFELRERHFSVKTFRFPPDERSREVDVLYDVFAGDKDALQQQLALVGIFNAYGPRLLEALREYDIVLVDRYMLSPLVTCTALGLDLKPIREALRSAIIPPDLTIVFTGKPFNKERPHDEDRAKFEAHVRELFEAEHPDYKHDTIRVTNDAMHTGKHEMFFGHLCDQLLGHLGRPLRKDA